MTFFSLKIFLWMAGAAAVAWVPPQKLQRYGMVAISAAFLGCYSPVSLAVLTVTATLGYLILQRAGPHTVSILSVVSGLTAILVWFKMDTTWTSSGLDGAPGGLVPLGISYYTFRQVHYTFEKYKGKLPEHGLVDYLSYLFFLPTLICGPIHLFPDFKRDLRRRRFDLGLCSLGFERILYGYAKIAILGNYLISEKFAEYIAEVTGAHPVLAIYLDCFRYGANLYFQFSGYSDIAIGFSLVMGFHIIENFNYPFLATNLVDFWQRWHISLSGWCRAYVYTPIASSTRKPIIAILMAMLVLGLWHELSLRFLCWGLFHGLGIAAWHLFQRGVDRLTTTENLFIKRGRALLGGAITINFVALSFVLAKEPDLSSAFQTFYTLLTLGG